MTNEKNIKMLSSFIVFALAHVILSYWGIGIILGLSIVYYLEKMPTIADFIYLLIAIYLFLNICSYFALRVTYESYIKGNPKV
ncbi:hypothetical protein HDR58_09910 [bacterium]|nr:hypothetical protein [bacterium]